MKNLNIAVIGASGGLGSAFVRVLADEPSNVVYALSRSGQVKTASNIQAIRIDYAEESSIVDAVAQIPVRPSLDWVIVATGILHDENMMPEKALGNLSQESLAHNFLVNAIGPALVAKHFIPLLRRDRPAVFAAMSARVGSIGDNRLGGWYSYRASKAALNMLIKTASLEVSRRQKQTVVVGLHPGTVATALSEPFQARVPEGKLFSADYSAGRLTAVIERLRPEDSGKILAWDGSEIPW